MNTHHADAGWATAGIGWMLYFYDMLFGQMSPATAIATLATIVLTVLKILETIKTLKADKENK